MQIAYILPLRLAYERMTRALFGPFDLVKWLVVGFAAWLAGLLEGGGGGWPGQYHLQGRPQDIPRNVGASVSRLLAEPIAVMLVVWLVLFVLTVVVLFTWLSSRGKFVFLDNVVHDRAEIVAPWRRLARQGNSLFVWRIVFALVALLGIAVLVAPPVLVLRMRGEYGPIGLAAVLSLVAIIVLAVIVLLYVKFFLECFVVPIMYRDGLLTNEAWRRFLPLLRREMGSFVLCGLFVIALSIGVLIVLAAFGCLTCCLGFLLMMLPYVGAVVLLPITYTYRAFGPEFLAQFGPEFSVWAAPSTEPAGPAVV